MPSSASFLPWPAQPSSRFLAFILAMAVITRTLSEPLKPVGNNLSCDNSVKENAGESFRSSGLIECEEKCEASTKCLAIIFWQQNNRCSIFYDWCEKPGTIRKWVSVFQKERKISASTTPEPTTRTLSQSLRPVDNNLSCGNSVKENAGESFKSSGISDCRNKCEASSKCVAIVFWQENNRCSVFHNWCEKPGTIRKWVTVEQKPYTAPKATTTTTATTKAAAKSLKPVDNNLSCGNSVKQDDGASFKSNGIRDCRNKCEASTKCLAIIFWQVGNFCSIFHDWCEKPGRIRQWVTVEQKAYTAPKATTTTTATTKATTTTTATTKAATKSLKPVDNNLSCGNSVKENARESFRSNGLIECEEKCEASSKCVAIIFWQEDNHCSIFHDWCEKPGTTSKFTNVYQKDHFYTYSTTTTAATTTQKKTITKTAVTNAKPIIRTTIASASADDKSTADGGNNNNIVDGGNNNGGVATVIALSLASLLLRL